MGSKTNEGFPTGSFRYIIYTGLDDDDIFPF